MKPMRQIFGEALLSLAPVFPEMVVLDADVSSSTQTCIFAGEYPGRFYNFGIAEQNMVAASAGMAACGKLPVVSSFAFLLTIRAADAVRSLIAYNSLNVKLAGAYGGLSDYADGASHQSVFDLSLMRSMPNMTVLCPSDADKTVGAVRAMLEYNGPVYLRLSRAEVDGLHGGDESFTIGKAVRLARGDAVTLCVCGTPLSSVLEAERVLRGEGISCDVLEYGTLKPFDSGALLESAARTGLVVSVEENNIIGGLGSAAAETLAEHGVPAKLLRIGLNDCFGESGPYESLISKHGLDAAGIIRAVKGIKAV